MKRFIKLIPFAACMAVAVVLRHPVAWTLISASVAFSLGVLTGDRHRTILRDRIHWLETRVDRVGDLGLEREVRMLRRRIAGLLLSKSVYERARRIVAPLAMSPAALADELETIDTSELEAIDVDWPTDAMTMMEELDVLQDRGVEEGLVSIEREVDGSGWLVDRIPALRAFART